MFSVNLYCKLIPFKKIAADSNASLPSLREDGLSFNTALSDCYKNRIFINFCSLVDVGSTELDLRTATSAPKKKKVSKKLAKESSYTISYLINSCGLSPEKAISASEKVHFETPEKPNSVIALLKNHGFSKTHIANLVRRRPVLLLSNPEKTLLPKLEFFKSIGVSEAHLAGTISRDPTLLTRSLENQIIPNYNYLKSVLLTDEKVAAAVKRTSWIFLEDPGKNLTPNITVLKELNVPQSCIILLLTHFPEAIMQRHDEFRASVSEVLEMGFNPLRSTFVLALHAISGKGNKTIWARCYETYSKLGWSRDDIYTAFRKHPNCMILSEKKITRTMDFLVNKMGWESKMIVSCPMVLFFNLENRIIPRCSTVQVLFSRELIKKKDVKLTTVLLPTEKCFLEKFVTKHEKQVPKLYDFYEGKIRIEEL
ncbi:transcription termination factor MTERF8, chloroplastic-like [Olea europaea var. sylvestris]|uniref:Transcription termination factor MTERF8, chloroplastic-like n=1 Tax=Olea europaea subsp. europaea TaxID=158383 RepID=A0A8S0RJ89_OLEEU|nr:transcription termination factor MTERF8, chloroplastic-like [Olea europaea var. sylvestris]CAA2979789.1 transcription termination factor MTERF8, chloroplastic-like [Olea europaea subsp. europaea]